MQLRCVASSLYAFTIETPFPSLRPYDLLAHRSQIAPRFEDRSKRKKRRGFMLIEYKVPSSGFRGRGSRGNLGS